MPIARYEDRPGTMGCTSALALVFLGEVALVALFSRDWLVAGLALLLAYHFYRGRRWAWWLVGVGFLANAAHVWWQLYQGPHDWAQLSLDTKVFQLPQLLFPMVFFGELGKQFGRQAERVRPNARPGGEGLAGVGAGLRPIPPARPRGAEAPMPYRDDEEGQ